MELVMRADYIESLPPAGIVDREELEARRYGGMNPSFVRQVWAKRRKEEGKAAPKRGRQPAWTEEDRARLADLLRAGLTYGQIAAKMGKTSSSISGAVHTFPELRAIGPQSAYAKRVRELRGSST